MALLNKRSLKQKSNQDDINVSNPDEESLHFPTKMDDYEFEGRIGRGAFASVYMARVKALELQVAIKVIELELTQSDDDENKNDEENDISWEEIQKEAAIMARMRHPNVVNCWSSFCVKTELWLVMEICIGSVLDCMKSVKEFNGGFLDETVICTMMRDVLSATQYIHNDGRVHRDIKAANILLSTSGVCQLSDFGVSGAIIEGGLRKNGRHTFTGSLWWMSPEVLQRENRHSYKADIWSIGITALELAFSRPPHSKSRPVKVMLQILQSDPPTIDSMRNGINTTSNHKFSKKFKDFLKCCLQKDPNKRLSAAGLLSHGFIKHAKDAQYLKEHVLSKFNHQKEIQKDFVPNSVAERRKQMMKEQNGNDVSGSDVPKLGKERVDSNGFDFDSEIHSISISGASGPVSPPDPPTSAIGRFEIEASNESNADSNVSTTKTTKGRFTIQDEDT